MAAQGFSVSPPQPGASAGELANMPPGAFQTPTANAHYRSSAADDSSLRYRSENVHSPYQQSLSSQPSESKLDYPDQSESGPAWAELKTKAGKDRKRLPLACIACRRKKIRCSGEKPACKHCLKARIPCVYKVTTRKAAPRTDYMAMLDKRLKRMEERVIKIIPKNDLPNVSRAVVKPNPSTTFPAKARLSKKRSANEAFNPDFDKWAHTSAQVDPGQSSPPKTGSADESNLLTEGLEHLPSPDIQQHLAEVYFDYVYGQSYPLLHKPSFMRRLEAGAVAPVLLLAVCGISARFSTHPQLQTEPAFLRGERWAKPALDIALKRFDCPNITILIVYLLLGTHEFATCQGGRSWMLGGMAHRMAYALQLHKDLDFDPQGQQRGSLSMLSQTDREIRRRAMWSCFMMDRFNSSGTQRPMFANEQYMYLQLPIKESLFQQDIPGPTETLQGNIARLGVQQGEAKAMDAKSNMGVLTDAKSNMGVAAYTVRLVAMWGHLVQYMNLGGRDKDEFPAWSPKSKHKLLRDELDGFLKSLPDDLKYSEENLLTSASEGLANQFLYLHIAYYHCVLFINRFAIPTTAQNGAPKNMPPEFLQESKEKVIDAATNISKLIEEAANYRVTAPFAGYCVVTSSSVHIYNIFASHNSQLEASAKKNLAINIAYLNNTKRYWGYFQFLTENLKDVYRQYAEGASTPTPRGKQVWQYGDWYDRYPHGVSKTELDEPSHAVKREEGDDAVLSQKPGVQSVEQYIESMSPTSRARQPQMAGRGGVKPPKKARQTKKKESSTTQSPDNYNVLRAPDSSIDAMDMSRGAFGPPESYDRSPMRAPMENPLAAVELQASQLGPSLPFEPAQQPGFVPQLDRRMVFASYNGVSPSATQDTTNFWDAEFNGLGDEMANDFNSAWFMPFNMNPPLTEFGSGNDFSMGGTMSGFPSDLWMPQTLSDQNGNAGMGPGRNG